MLSPTGTGTAKVFHQPTTGADTEKPVGSKKESPAAPSDASPTATQLDKLASGPLSPSKVLQLVSGPAAGKSSFFVPVTEWGKPSLIVSSSSASASSSSGSSSDSSLKSESSSSSMTPGHSSAAKRGDAVVIDISEADTTQLTAVLKKLAAPTLNLTVMVTKVQDELERQKDETLPWFKSVNLTESGEKYVGLAFFAGTPTHKPVVGLYNDGKTLRLQCDSVQQVVQKLMLISG